MHEKVVALFLLCCSLTLLLTTTKVVGVNIGGIINPSSRIGMEERLAMEIGVEDFNSLNKPLFLTMRNSSLAAPTTVQDLTTSEWKADVVFVGTGTWSEENIISQMKDMVKNPIVVTFPSSSSSTLTRPWLLQFSGKFSSRVSCIADVVGSYNWRRVNVIYEDNGLGTISTESIAILYKALRSVGSDIQQSKSIPPFNSLLDPKTTIHETLNNIKKDNLCQVFIVLQSSPSFTTTLFQQAQSLGMMSQGYVWITTNNNIINTQNHMQGVVDISNQVNQSNPSYKTFLHKFKQRFRTYYGGEDSNHGPTIHALRVYDAIHAISIAQTTKDMTKSNTNFHGLSGTISLTNGMLSTKDNVFGISNVVGSGIRNMGFWSQGVGFHKDYKNKTLGNSNASKVFGAVYWPGGPLWLPGGWGVLDVVVPARTVFDEFVKVEYDSNGKLERVSGYSINIFELALARIPYRLDVRYHPYNGTYDKMVESVYTNKTIYAAVGDITILGYRSKHVDFTEPYMDSGLSKLVPLKTVPRTWMFTKPFSWRLWLTIVLASFYTGIIVWFLENNSPNSKNYDGKKWKQIGNGVWFAYLTFFFSQGNLYNNFARVAILVWLFTALALTQSYTASLSSILTVQKLQPEKSTRTIEQIGCDGDSFVLDYLKNVLRIKENNIHTINSETKYPQAFESENITAAYIELPYLRFFLSKYGDDFTTAGESYRFAGLGFAFKKGSPITSDVSTAILSLIEDGTLKSETSKVFKVDLFSCPRIDPTKDNNNLDIDSFWILFIISGATSTIAFFLFLIMMIKNKRGEERVAPEGINEDQQENGLEEGGASKERDLNYCSLNIDRITRGDRPGHNRIFSI